MIQHYDTDPFINDDSRREHIAHAVSSVALHDFEIVPGIDANDQCDVNFIEGVEPGIDAGHEDFESLEGIEPGINIEEDEARRHKLAVGQIESGINIDHSGSQFDPPAEKERNWDTELR